MNTKLVKDTIQEHATKIALAGTAVIATVGQGAAMSSSDITNGSALIQAGISVAQTEPLGTIISAVGVAFGALIFVKIVRRFY